LTGANDDAIVVGMRFVYILLARCAIGDPDTGLTNP
jgi:hypothetical protein